MQIQQWMNANTTGGAQLIALAPLPDELDRGYLGTLMRANAISSDLDMYKLLAKEAGGNKESRNYQSRVELLSVVSRKNLGTFIRESPRI